MKKYISYIYVILSAVCWGFIGFSNRLLTAAGIELGNRVFIRNFGTLLVLTVVFGLFTGRCSASNGSTCPSSCAPASSASCS